MKTFEEICENCGKTFNKEPPYSSNCPFCNSLYGMSKEAYTKFIKVAKENPLSPEAMCLDTVEFRESIAPDLFREIPTDKDVSLSHMIDKDDKIKFKDKFPSLIGRTFDIDWGSQSKDFEDIEEGDYIDVTDVKDNCLDKQICKKELDELEKDAYESGMTEQLKGAIQRLRRRLLE